MMTGATAGGPAVSSGDDREETILRRVAVLAAALAATAGVGWAGVGAASAASPALKIKPNGIWTLLIKAVPGCEEDQFDTVTHTFSSDNFADSGTWSGGGSTINMAWTVGADKGLTFNGHFVSSTSPVEYKGLVSSGNTKGTLVKGPVAGC
jgi:hypothetical protein